MSEDPTQISLRTVLEAVNSLGVEVHNLGVELNHFRQEMKEFRESVETKLDEIDERMNVLAGDIVKVRAREALMRRILARAEGRRNLREGNDVPEKERHEVEP
jgi:hypothetical protein